MKEEHLIDEGLIDEILDFGLNQYHSLPDVLKNIERNLIVWALSRCKGNKRKAARILKMKYTTFNAKVQKYDVNFMMSVW